MDVCVCVCACVFGRSGEGGWRVEVVKLYLSIPRPSFLNSCHSWPSPPSGPGDTRVSVDAPSACRCSPLSMPLLQQIQQMWPSGSGRSRRGTAGHPAAASLRCTPGNSRRPGRPFAEAGSYCPPAGCRSWTLLSVSPYCCHPDRGNKTPPLWRYPLEMSLVVNTGQQVVGPSCCSCCCLWSLGSMWPAGLTGRAHPGSPGAGPGPGPGPRVPPLFWKVSVVQSCPCLSSLSIRTLQLCGGTSPGLWSSPRPWRKMILPSRNPSGNYRALCYSDMTFWGIWQHRGGRTVCSTLLQTPAE